MNVSSIAERWQGSGKKRPQRDQVQTGNPAELAPVEGGHPVAPSQGGGGNQQIVSPDQRTGWRKMSPDLRMLPGVRQTEGKDRDGIEQTLHKGEPTGSNARVSGPEATVQQLGGCDRRHAYPDITQLFQHRFKAEGTTLGREENRGVENHSHGGDGGGISAALAERSSAKLAASSGWSRGSAAHRWPRVRAVKPAGPRSPPVGASRYRAIASRTTRDLGRSRASAHRVRARARWVGSRRVRCSSAMCYTR